MIIVIIADCKKYAYHKHVADIICNYFENNVEIVDISEKVPIYEVYNRIFDLNPSLIVNLDIVGFVMLTESNTLSLNSIHSRIVNILFHKKNHYGKELKYMQSLSMFTFFSMTDDMDNGCTKELENEYPMIPNIDFFCHYDYSASQGDLEVYDDNFIVWIKYMLEKVRL